jgi:hypothetical protein
MTTTQVIALIGVLATLMGMQTVIVLAVLKVGIGAVNEKIDTKFTALDSKIDDKFGALDHRLTDIEAAMPRHLITPA